MHCPICGGTADTDPTLGDSTTVHCPSCGEYEIVGTAIAILAYRTPSERALALDNAKRSAEPGKRPVIRGHSL